MALPAACFAHGLLHSLSSFSVFLVGTLCLLSPYSREHEPGFAAAPCRELLLILLKFLVLEQLRFQSLRKSLPIPAPPFIQ